MNATDVSVRPLGPFGAEILGLRAADAATPETAKFLRDAWHKHKLLLLRDQDISQDEQMRFARIFGTISTARNADDGYNFVSNVTEGGRNPIGELGYHFDNSFMPVPLTGLMLYGIEVPPEGEGGNTLFANVQLAYETLPAALRERINGMTIRHGNPDKSKHEGLPGLDEGPDALRADHPLVYRHPATCEPFLFLSRRHADHIVGLPRAESDALIEELVGYLYKDEHVLRHVWRPRDLVVWDNLALQHGRNNFDPKWKRHLRRVAIEP